MFAKPREYAMLERLLDVSSHSAAGGWGDATRTALPPAFSIFSLRRLRERVRRDGELLGELAVAEDLDAVDAALDELALAKRLLVDLGAGVEALELADVDVGDDVGERVAEAALRQAALHRRLTALEVQLVDVALRASLLALLPAAGGLAEAGADAAADARLLGDRALRAARAWRECQP